jgi:hypothetical protein
MGSYVAFVPSFPSFARTVRQFPLETLIFPPRHRTFDVNVTLPGESFCGGVDVSRSMG